MKGHSCVPIEADRWKQDALQIGEGDGAMGFVVEVVTELTLLAVQSNTNNAALSDTTVRALEVFVVVHEPASLLVNVHGPGPSIPT